uniref:Lipoxygenase domain-containing protein n=1 Tax=Ciona savignyi TaxID=51511 RepID=H2Y9R8_CIOSA
IDMEKRIKVNEWLCDRIIVIYGEQKVCFPVYDWIESEYQIPTGEASLPQKVENPFLKSERAQEIDRNRGIFCWCDLPTEQDIDYGLPRHVNAATYDELPRMFQRKQIRAKDFKHGFIAGGLNSIKNKFLVQPIKSWDCYKALYKGLRSEVSNYTEDWSTDEGMGRQVLTGISPLAFKRMTHGNPNFDGNNQDITDALEGRSLEPVMEAGGLYISDYSEIYRDVDRCNDLYCPDAVGLFYVNKLGNFVPIAIQLVPGCSDYLFTPSNCSDMDWLLAKMYFRCAAANEHEWGYHFLYTHNMVEPFGVALFRCLPTVHPVYKLMRPHLRTSSAINTDARTQLITRDGFPTKAIATSATSLTQKMFKSTKFQDLIIPKVLKKQGTDDSAVLPNYHYRDDALALWKIMEDYVSDLLKSYYTSDEDVKDDYELQGWAQDVAHEGLGWDGNTRGFPDSITTIEQLVEICVTVMFTSSAQHAAVNFGQFDTYKFIPNCPGAMRLPPHKRGEATMQRILDSLPDQKMASIQIMLTYALSQFADDEVYLGQFPETFFTDETAVSIQQRYTDQLADLEKKIELRNASLKHPYVFLLPSRVPRGVAI